MHGIPIHVAGEEEGEYRLIVFSGKLKKLTTCQTEPRLGYLFSLFDFTTIIFPVGIKLRDIKDLGHDFTS